MEEQKVVDPYDTDYTSKSRSDLEWWLLFSIAVAGWRSEMAAAALGRFKFYIYDAENPLMVIDDILKYDPEHIDYAFEQSRFRFKRTKRSFIEAAREFWCRDLRELTVEELESIHGIGPKTARFFLFTAVPGVRYAALDTHILKWLAKLGYDVPKATPSGKNYEKVEGYFLLEADKRGLAPSELDLAVWQVYKNGGVYDG